MTPKQHKLLQFIRTTEVRTGKGPTFSEMRNVMDVRYNQSITDFLSALLGERYIIKEANLKTRNIRTTKKGRLIRDYEAPKFSEGSPLPNPLSIYSSTAFDASQLTSPENPHVVISFSEGGDAHD